MQVKVEEINKTQREIAVTVEAQLVTKLYNEIYNSYFKNARVPGFRKGHLPVNIFLNQYGATITTEAYERIVNRTMHTAFIESKLDIFSIEKFADSGMVERNKDLTYKVIVNIYPTLDFEQVKGTKLEYLKVEISDEDRQEMISSFQNRYAEYEEAADAVIGANTKAEIDFVGKKDGVEFEGGKSSNFEYIVGETKFIPGFEEQLLNHKAGDEFTFEIRFPEDYSEKNLAGQLTTFDIKVHKVFNKIKPEPNVEFFKQFKSDIETEEDFYKLLNENMTREASHLSLNYHVQKVADSFAKCFGAFEYPEAYAQDTAERLVGSNFRTSSINNIPEELRKNLASYLISHEREKVDANARRSLVIHSFMEQFCETPTREEVLEFAAKEAVAFEDPEEFILEVKKNKEIFNSVAESAALTRFVEKAREFAEVSEKTVSFKELRDIIMAEQTAEAKEKTEEAKAE